MNIVVTGIAVIIVIIGIYVNRVNFSRKTSSRVLSLDTSTPEPTQSPIPTNITIIPTSTPQPISPNLSEYRYPNSTVESLSDNSMSLRSADDPKVITDWYKNKINAKGMNIKTFVQTSTNSNVVNKLVGAKAGLEIRVEITKKAGDSVTEISVFIET
ncbi:hypothetical protein HY008_01585 [Candidatus Woesebacteria bacterium]|nr:hypothetical protein [Candidatus Woesebacteria bacterium]